MTAAPSLVGLGESDPAGITADVNQSVPSVATRTQEEAPGLINLGSDGPKHDGEAARSTRPHERDGTPAAAPVPLPVETPDAIAGEPDGWILLNADGNWVTAYSIEENAKWQASQIGGKAQPFRFTAPVHQDGAAAPVCKTCNNNGMIGGPSYREPDEGGVPCPDCAAPGSAEASSGVAAQRKAAKALEGVIAWDKARNYIVPYNVRDPVIAALAAIKAELKG